MMRCSVVWCDGAASCVMRHASCVMRPASCVVRCTVLYLLCCCYYRVYFVYCVMK